MERAQSWEPLLTIWCQGENSVFQWKGPTVSSSRFWMARLVMKATASPRLLSWVVCWMRHSTSFASKGAVSFFVAKVESLAEFNPMLGHRGCRLGNTYPEITEMQTRAIIEAAMNVKAAGIPVHVEIMVPLVGNHKELRYQKNIIDRTAEQVFTERNDKIEYMVGTMIEVPRAAVTANQIAEVAQFFSFGTNDLTQMTLGFSRDDISKFLPVYLEKGILKNDPFQILEIGRAHV